MKDLGDDFEMEARRVRRKEAAENGASGGHLDGRKSSLAVLDFENPRDVFDSDRRGMSEGGTEEREDERERNNGGKVRVHDGSLVKIEKKEGRFMVMEVVYKYRERNVAW